MRYSAFYHGEVWDVVISRSAPTSLIPVWLCKKDMRFLLCQIQNDGRFGWTVVVSGPVRGLRIVNGFKQRWQAIAYACNVRSDLDHHDD